MISDFTSEFNKNIILNATLVDSEGNPLYHQILRLYETGFSLAYHVINFYVNGKYIGSNITNNDGYCIL